MKQTKKLSVLVDVRPAGEEFFVLEQMDKFFEN
jgi:hypothetical protein